MNDLLKKLKESGLIVPANQLASKPGNPKRIKFDDVFIGSWDLRQSGDVFIIHEIRPYGYKHGNLKIRNNSELSNFSKFEHFPTDSDTRIAYFDIETSNLSFGAGSFVFLIGICYLTDSGIETNLLMIEHPSAEKGLLEVFNTMIDKFDVICSYNGKSFDAPFIRNRNAFHRLDHTLAQKHHIDLLTYARRLWKIRLESCRLSEIERTILCVDRDESEIPGWLVPQTYLDFLQNRDAHILKGVVYHNMIDVVSLAALFQHISDIIQHSKSGNEIEPVDFFSLAKLYESVDDLPQAGNYYQLALDGLLEPDIAKQIQRKYALLLKRLGDLKNAVVWWEKSALAGDIESCIQLSMYYEHKQKDYDQAGLWAEKAMSLVKIQNDGTFHNPDQIDDISHRLDRISRKKTKNEK